MMNGKIPLLALTLTLLLNLLGIIATSDPAAATPDEVKWSKVNIPTEGDTGNWVLANGQWLKRAIPEHGY